MDEHIEIHPSSNRKRVLDLSESIEAEGSSRRLTLSSDWHETSNSVADIPTKKGFSRNETDLKESLVDNYEDSSHGLSVDLSSSSYRMNEAKIGTSKDSLQDSGNKAINSNSKGVSCTKACHSSMTDRFFKFMGTEPYDDGHSATSFQQLLEHHLSCNENLKNEASEDHISRKYMCSDDIIVNSLEASSDFQLRYKNNKFQCILGASTSIAAKVNEESLTYLNQGQSYEMKIKKLGDITKCQGWFYHTKIRVCFQERRLQYMEKEQLSNWKLLRPGERIIEIDIPLSYGISEFIQDSKAFNYCEFDWEPAREVSVYIKVNCISTEFTHKKHGGEKGVPFRLQVETFCQTENDNERVHAYVCQIKVFKLKGADRKHKQDKEKLMKRPHEISKYQQQCDYTILKELPLEPLSISNSEEESSPSHFKNYINKVIKSSPSYESSSNNSIKCTQDKISETCKIDETGYGIKLIDSSSSVDETRLWLISNRFSHLTSMFDNFGGTDILRLSKSELIEICGLVDGIRLFNALYFRNIYPRLTLHISIKNDQLPIYNTVYLEKMTLTELIDKLSKLISISPKYIYQLYLQGPSNINILVTDEVIQNFKDETTFIIDVVQKVGDEKYCLILQSKGPSPKPNFIF